jgi:hypothetical protein
MIVRIISEQTLEIDEEFCNCFIEWHTAFNGVKWTKFMQFINEADINWSERRLISKLYVDQSVKVRLDKGETRNVKTGRGVRQGISLSNDPAEDVQLVTYPGSS